MNAIALALVAAVTWHIFLVAVQIRWKDSMPDTARLLKNAILACILAVPICCIIWAIEIALRDSHL